MSWLDFDYYFFITALCTTILGITSGAVGTIIILEKQSQLGDALGHAVYPGVILTFMIFQTRRTIYLLIGACIAGVIAYKLIQCLKQWTTFKYDAILAAVLSPMFGLGLMLYQIISRYPKLQTVNFAGLDHYIMGQAALLTQPDAILVIFTSISVLVIFASLFPKIGIYLFDQQFAYTTGISIKTIRRFILALFIINIVSGLQSVGAILISNLLVAPPIAASLWTSNYRTMVILSAFMGAVSSLLGTILSNLYNIPTGPCIVILATFLAFISLIIAPKGIFRNT